MTAYVPFSFTALQRLIADKEIIPRYSANKQAAWALTRKELLIVQFTKLINYFPDDLDQEWGFAFYALGDYNEALRSLKRFLDFTEADELERPFWISKKYEQLPWGPANFRWSKTPSATLGAPFDPYLASNGGILTTTEAARILRLDPRELIQVKLRLLIDEAVIAEALSRMLKFGNWNPADKPTS